MLACQRERALAAAPPDVKVIIIGDGDAQTDANAGLVTTLREYYGHDAETFVPPRSANYVTAERARLRTPRGGR